MTIEDTWGGDIGTAAIAHLAHSTPPQFLFSTTDFNSYVTVSTVENPPTRREGRLEAPKEPGLGIRPQKGRARKTGIGSYLDATQGSRKSPESNAFELQPIVKSEC